MATKVLVTQASVCQATIAGALLAALGKAEDQLTRFTVSTAATAPNICRRLAVTCPNMAAMVTAAYTECWRMA